MLISANIIYLISIFFLIFKSHIIIIIVLANLNFRNNNSDLDEPFFLKKIMASFYLKNFEKAIYAEF